MELKMMEIRIAAAVYFAVLAIVFFITTQHSDFQAGLDSQMAGRLTHAWLCGCF
jgi:hypothetical protein